MINSKGKIFYGLHMYPGVAEYREADSDPFRIFLNEDTIRAMGPTFAGRPVFVFHVDDVADDVDALRNEADGWVIESFYNEADGKHWAKFIVVSKRGEDAIRKGYRLSNAYLPKGYGKGGEWNGVTYDKRVLNGEYEHLAIVPNPRYEESIILTPEEFKAYNERKTSELLKLKNSKGKNVAFKFFKRSKVENSADIESIMVHLPTVKRDVSITQLINEADKAPEKYVSDDAIVKVGDKDMTVGALRNAFENACKKNKDDDDKKENDDDDVDDDEVDDDDIENEDDDDIENEDREDDKEAKRKAEDIVRHEERELAEKKNKKKNKKKNDRADALRNAGTRYPTAEELAPDFTSQGGTQRGKARYGS